MNKLGRARLVRRLWLGGISIVLLSGPRKVCLQQSILELEFEAVMSKEIVLLLKSSYILVAKMLKTYRKS